MQTRVFVLMKEVKHTAAVKSLFESKLSDVSVVAVKTVKHLFQLPVSSKDVLVISDMLPDGSWVTAVPVARKMAGYLLIAFRKGKDAVTPEVAQKYGVSSFFTAPFKSEELVEAVRSLLGSVSADSDRDISNDPLLKELQDFYDEMENRNYYELFSVPSNADVSLIKRAYVQLAKKFHPDRYRFKAKQYQDIAYSVTKRINEAYSVLTHPNRHIVYDKQLHDNPSQKRFDFHMKVAYDDHPEDTIISDSARKMVTLAQQAMEMQEYKQALTQLKMANSVEKGNAYIETLLKEAQEKLNTMLNKGN